MTAKDQQLQRRIDRDRRTGWLQTWRAAVRSCASAVGLIQLPSTRLLELSPAGAELLGTTPEEGIGIDLMTRVERPHETAMVNWLLATGVVDAVHVRRPFHGSDGAMVDVPIFARAIRSTRAGDLLLWVSGDIVTSAPPARVPDVAGEAGVQGGETDRPPQAVLDLDDTWRVTRLLGNVDDLLGARAVELVGMPFMDLVHPLDRAVLLLALARATTDTNAGERLVRLESPNGTWRPLAVRPMATDEEGVPRFSLALREALGPPSAGVPVTKLDDLLQRITRELREAGVLVTTTDPGEIPQSTELMDLSARQQEVVARLLRGERVPRIAKEMYLSQSTIRNHLAAIFRKFGVHSQDELLARLRDAPLTDPRPS